MIREYPINDIAFQILLIILGNTQNMTSRFTSFTRKVNVIGQTHSKSQAFGLSEIPTFQFNYTVNVKRIWLFKIH